MERIRKKSVTQKIIIAIVMVLLFNFSVPQVSNADKGGTLFSPLVTLVATIGDGVQWLLQWAILGKTDPIMADNPVAHDARNCG